MKTNLNIAILSYASPKYKSNKLIIKTGQKRNHNVFVLNPKNLVMYLSDKEGEKRIYTNENGILERLPKIDALIPRLASNVSHCANIIEFLTNNLGLYSVQSGDSIRVCSSKWHTLMRANEHGIKVPKTISCDHFDSSNIDAYAESLKFDLLLKLNSSSQGIGIIKFSEKSALKNTIETLNKQGTSFILQEMIKARRGSKQTDFRTIVIGRNNCVVTMQKTATNRSEFRTNLARQGTAEKYELSDKQRQFCLRVARTIDSDICAIDWIQDGQNRGEPEPILLENNSNMGTKIIDITGYNFFEDLFNHIEKSVEINTTQRKINADAKKENELMEEEVLWLRNELSKKEEVLKSVLQSDRMKLLLRQLKGKELNYLDSENKSQQIKITKAQDVIQMMSQMLVIEQ
jgi:ribosomal protein S6--L-glutamate ligase